MGFRMYIKHKCKEYGGDHKLYGYQDIKDLTSFPILIPEIRRQWGIPTTYSDEDIYSECFCISSATDDLILDEIIFSVFAKRYCDDIRRAFSTDGGYATNYMEELINSSGEKILSWC